MACIEFERGYIELALRAHAGCDIEHGQDVSDVEEHHSVSKVYSGTRPAPIHKCQRKVSDHALTAFRTQKICTTYLVQADSR